MFVPGQIEQWVHICDLANLGIVSLPREQIIALGKFMQANIKYNLARSFYLQTGWGMRLFYKGVKWMVDPETLEKFAIEGAADPQSLIDLYHPSQLEKRFGGKAETPTNFWPP